MLSRGFFSGRDAIGTPKLAANGDEPAYTSKLIATKMIEL